MCIPPPQVIVHLLRQPVPVERRVVQLMERVFLTDDSCKWFYKYHGAITAADPDAPAVNGRFLALPAAGASKYYVGVVNHFGELGGFDAIIARLDQRVRVCVRACVYVCACVRVCVRTRVHRVRRLRFMQSCCGMCNHLRVCLPPHRSPCCRWRRWPASPTC